MNSRLLYLQNVMRVLRRILFFSRHCVLRSPRLKKKLDFILSFAPSFRERLISLASFVPTSNSETNLFLGEYSNVIYKKLKARAKR